MALSGLELALHALLVTACAWAWLAGGTETNGRAWATGGLLALGALARLDVMLLAIALAAAVRLRPVGRARVLALLAPPVLVLGAYLVWNQAAFGHPLPVSAAAKRLWSGALLLRDPGYQAGGWLWAKLGNALFIPRHLGSAWVLGLALGTVGAAVLSFTPAGRCTRALRPFAAAGIAQLAAYNLLHHGELTWARWYYALPPLMAAFAAADLVAWAAGRVTARARRVLGVAACVLVALAQATSLARWRREPSARVPLLDAAVWARASLPPDARIGAWNSGTLGYLSGRTVVNLDGLVNSWAFLESEQYDLCAYWDRNRITHVIDAFSEDGPGGTPVVVPVVLPASRAYARCADRLQRVWEGGPEGRSWRVRAYLLTDAP
jgi:hypothetical protein